MTDYHTALQNFVDTLNATGLSAYVLTGRRYDRVMIRTAQYQSTVRFFIDRSDRAIYGVRSTVAPNTKHWYGTLGTVTDWEWQHIIPTPKNPDHYTYLGRYGVYDRWAAK